MARILLIEDDRELGRLLLGILERAGHEVRLAENGVRGLVSLREDPPELVVLDLGLPDLTGDEILGRIRASQDLPVLVLTAARDLERKVRLLREGADDYLEKPFHPEELLARIEALLRRHAAGKQLAVGALVLDLESGRARLGEAEVALSPRELAIAALLARRPGRVYSKEEILAAVWEDATLRSNALEVHLAKLRSKLGEIGAGRYLRTVRGRGYALLEPGE